MNVIGRVKELDEIEQCVSSGRPEFMVVYGRRRVGKTFLIKEYFNNRFSFYATGLLNGKTKSQLKIFKESLIEYGDEEKAIPKDWFEAFRRLRKVLEAPTVCRDVASGRRVIFLDEVPWMDTARSDFKAALDYFWNSWASSQKDLLLIVCGSATSWIINNILFDKGGFYNRITRQLNIKPFSLGECAEYFQNYGFTFTKKQVIDCYMVFGGIPYYFNLFDKRLSLVQNINNLVIDPQGQLHYEYEHLFSSLFKNAATHVKIISVIAEQKWGVQRTDIVDKTGISDGEGLTRALRELEQCGFIRKYKNMTSKIKGSFFQVVDPFVLFSHYYLQDDKLTDWLKFYKSAAFYAWRGNAFEIVALCHIQQIKKCLGISGVSSEEYSWKSIQKNNGAQIDLIIDRRDDVMNICEMKYSDDEYVIDSEYEKEIIHKVELFRKEVEPEKALHVTLVTVSGLKKNEHSDVVLNIIKGEDLF